MARWSGNDGREYTASGLGMAQLERGEGMVCIAHHSSSLLADSSAKGLPACPGKNFLRHQP